MAKRKSTGKRLRFEVFKRDGFKCVYCGRCPPDVLLHVDHVVAVANGGDEHDPANLVTSCADCNLGKSSVPLSSVAPSLKQQAEEAQERAEQVRAYAEAVLEARAARDETVQAIANAWYDPFNPRPGEWAYSFPRERLATIRRFLEMLPIDEILDAVDVAHRAAAWKPDLQIRVREDNRITDGNAFRYFCGVCWKKVDQRKLLGAC